VNRIGSQRIHIVEAHDFSGGIWVLWKLESVTLIVIDSDNQFVTHENHVKVTTTNVYSP